MVWFSDRQGCLQLRLSYMVPPLLITSFSKKASCTSLWGEKMFASCGGICTEYGHKSPTNHTAILFPIFDLKITLAIQLKLAVLAPLPRETVVTKNAWMGSNPLCSCLELFCISSGGSSPHYWGKGAVRWSLHSAMLRGLDFLQGMKKTSMWTPPFPSGTVASLRELPAGESIMLRGLVHFQVRKL